MESIPSTQSITVKLVCMVVLILADLLINSFVESSFGLKINNSYTANFYFIPIQILITFMIFIMVLILLWQTFPLRYGLIGTLCSKFKMTFIVVLGFIVLTVLERGLRLSFALGQTNNFSEPGIWNYSTYVVFYYLRYLFYPIFYAFLFNFCIKVLHPEFYRPDVWLK